MSGVALPQPNTLSANFMSVSERARAVSGMVFLRIIPPSSCSQEALETDPSFSPEHLLTSPRVFIVSFIVALILVCERPDHARPDHTKSIYKI